jgi:hypothetical protein
MKLFLNIRNALLNYTNINHVLNQIKVRYFNLIVCNEKARSRAQPGKAFSLGCYPKEDPASGVNVILNISLKLTPVPSLLHKEG